jgi:hypothetical protein
LLNKQQIEGIVKSKGLFAFAGAAKAFLAQSICFADK